MQARKFGEHERSVRAAQGAAEIKSCILSALQTSQFKGIGSSIHAQLKERRSQFFIHSNNNLALKHVLFVINYKVLTMHCEGKQM